MSNMQITFSTRRIIWLLAVAVVVLTTASAGVQIAKYYLGHDQLLGAVRVFDADREGNIPAWYSSISFLICAILLAVIAISKKGERNRYWLHWAALSAIFSYFSLDEAAAIHELLILPLRSYLNAESFLYWSWVVVGIVFVLVFLLVYSQFILSLPARTRNHFILAGLLFVIGSIGMELISGNYIFVHEEKVDLTYAIMTTFEEFLEMTGILIFIYGLMVYLRSQVKGLHILIKK